MRHTKPTNLNGGRVLGLQCARDLQDASNLSMLPCFSCCEVC